MIISIKNCSNTHIWVTNQKPAFKQPGFTHVNLISIPLRINECENLPALF
jgi:hypothetical protein